MSPLLLSPKVVDLLECQSSFNTELVAGLCAVLQAVEGQADLQLELVRLVAKVLDHEQGFLAGLVAGLTGGLRPSPSGLEVN